METELEPISGAAALLAEKIALRSGSKTPLTTLQSRVERERYLADLSNKKPGTLTGMNCSECLNRGYFHRVREDGSRYTEECKCMIHRKNLERLEKSGLRDMTRRYTFKKWEQTGPEQIAAYSTAMAFCQNPNGWLVVSGRPGTGKTHICTAVCVEMMRNSLSVRYVMWREFATNGKSMVNESEEYKQLMEPLKKAKVLYIDDFFKTGNGQDPTTADVNLAFELLNYRYNDSKLITIISTEYSLERMMEIDEAVGSRIYERSKRFYLPMQGENWRTKEG